MVPLADPDPWVLGVGTPEDGVVAGVDAGVESGDTLEAAHPAPVRTKTVITAEAPTNEVMRIEFLLMNDNTMSITQAFSISLCVFRTAHRQ